MARHAIEDKSMHIDVARPPHILLFENCSSVTPLPMAAVDETPPVTVLSKLSTYSAPLHYYASLALWPNQKVKRERQANLLMRQHIRAELSFLPLDKFDVGLHALLRVLPCEQVRDVTVRVQTTELSRPATVSAHATTNYEAQESKC